MPENSWWTVELADLVSQCVSFLRVLNQTASPHLEVEVAFAGKVPRSMQGIHHLPVEQV